MYSFGKSQVLPVLKQIEEHIDNISHTIDTIEREGRSSPQDAVVRRTNQQDPNFNAVGVGGGPPSTNDNAVGVDQVPQQDDIEAKIDLNNAVGVGGGPPSTNDNAVGVDQVPQQDDIEAKIVLNNAVGVGGGPPSTNDNAVGVDQAVKSNAVGDGSGVLTPPSLAQNQKEAAPKPQTYVSLREMEALRSKTNRYLLMNEKDREDVGKAGKDVEDAYNGYKEMLNAATGLNKMMGSVSDQAAALELFKEVPRCGKDLGGDGKTGKDRHPLQTAIANPGSVQ